MDKKAVVVAGASGLVGKEVIKLLAARPDLQVTALVRKRSFHALPSHLKEFVFDFSNREAYAAIGTNEIPCHAIICCLGTTMRLAKSKAQFRQVEQDFPLTLAARALAISASFGFVSSAGAGRPVGFYLKTKAETEAGIAALGIPHVLVRPSLLLGARHEYRPGERLATLVLPPVAHLLESLTFGKAAFIGRLKPIRAAKVAEVLVKYTVDAPSKAGLIVEGYDFFKAH